MDLRALRRTLIGFVLIAASGQTGLTAAASAEPAAKLAFGAVERPSPHPPQAIGTYGRGCLAGALPMPQRGPTWQTMRPSRNRAWGHPQTIGFLKDLAYAAPRLGVRGLLFGDISQPRGGPMTSGHTSHQIGLDADVWLTEMPPRPLSRAERDAHPFESVIDDSADGIDPTRLTEGLMNVIEAAARDERVERIFVSPLIKRALCRRATASRGWLGVVRPWYGHDAHFHVRLRCPQTSPQCRPQRPPPEGDGCGAPLDYWFTAEPFKPRTRTPSGPITLAQLPAPCRALVAPFAVPKRRPTRSPPPQAATPTGQLTPVPPSPQ